VTQALQNYVIVCSSNAMFRGIAPCLLLAYFAAFPMALGCFFFSVSYICLRSFEASWEVCGPGRFHFTKAATFAGGEAILWHRLHVAELRILWQQKSKSRFPQTLWAIHRQNSLFFAPGLLQFFHTRYDTIEQFNVHGLKSWDMNYEQHSTVHLVSASFRCCYVNLNAPTHETSTCKQYLRLHIQPLSGNSVINCGAL